jgi:hypothetical protein
MLNKFTERRAQQALAVLFEWDGPKKCFVNVCMYDWEMDFCVLTPAGYLWEVEVKCTVADWKADLHKSKWDSRHRKNINRFYYAVPHPLISKTPDFVPEHVGLISLHINDQGGVSAQLYREAKPFNKNKISPADIIRLFKTTYYKYWRDIRHQPDISPRLGMQPGGAVAMGDAL